MTTQTVYQCCLLLHITGIILFAGTTVVDFITHQQFWKQYALDQSKAKAVWEAMSKFPRLMGIGIILIIITAVGMMALTKGVFGEQIWLRIKFPIVVITILNGLLVGRRQGAMLSKLLQQAGVGISEKIEKVKKNLTVFHSIQLVLLFSILLLSVFKFN
jgi:hypothetical protein